MEQNRGVWTGVVIIVVFAALLVWWVAARRPLSSSTDVGQSAAQEPAATAPATGVVAGNITKVSRSTQNVATIVRGLPGSSSFNALFTSTGVSASITSGGKYTIFVPTNGAFAQLAGGTIANMTAAEKKRLVQYHVVSGRAIDVSAELAGTIQAVSGDYLNFSYGPEKIPMVNSAITITEYTGRNGIVYLIDNVLLPPKKAPGTL